MRYANIVYAIVKKGTNDVGFKCFAQSSTLRGMIYLSSGTADRALCQLDNKEDYEIKKYNLGELTDAI